MWNCLFHLYKEGYFRDANFLRRSSNGYLDFSCFEDSNGRAFIKFAVEKVSQRQLGNGQKSAFSAKRLRSFFEIGEKLKRVLKHLCKCVNQNVWRAKHQELNLTDAVNEITLCAFDAVPSLLVVPDELKASTGELLKEVLKLSQTSSYSQFIVFTNCSGYLQGHPGGKTNSTRPLRAAKFWYSRRDEMDSVASSKSGNNGTIVEGLRKSSNFCIIRGLSKVVSLG
ncbi:hypothetical protein FEM48_Zijuj12G0117200 [Ziziphus jujuba var. spinosa]|uniref:Uncharacterized protein n=1 Tax=Ziziphus jujuba var. spinosa TaxID=714518 RepID=A0A978UD44_ZIZJJ|nr:hypothetical protein FEM48_Zijuj12G0117200 [Ziziphus jujuba var. spinosa]